jgi:hypothetical protein
MSSVRKAQAYPVCPFDAVRDGTGSVTTQPGGKLPLYHREMLGEDLSGRFDYLFEPLEVDESAGNGDGVAPRARAEPGNGTPWSNRIVLAGVVLATLAAAAATAIVLMQPAQPAQQVVIPNDTAPPSTTAATAPPMMTTTAPAVPVLPATVSASAGPTPPATTTTSAQPPPVQQPTTVASEPPAPMPTPPTTRAPISVSPESRAPFPNQTPPGNNEQGGGLLGGLL